MDPRSRICSCVENEVEGTPVGVQRDYNQCAVDNPEVKIRFCLEGKARPPIARQVVIILAGIARNGLMFIDSSVLLEEP